MSCLTEDVIAKYIEDYEQLAPDIRKKLHEHYLSCARCMEKINEAIILKNDFTREEWDALSRDRFDIENFIRSNIRQNDNLFFDNISGYEGNK